MDTPRQGSEREQSAEQKAGQVNETPEQKGAREEREAGERQA